MTILNFAAKVFKNFSKFIFISLLLMFNHNSAAENFWNQRAKGWHWYEDLTQEFNKTEDKSDNQNFLNKSTKQPLAKEIIEKNKQLLEESLSEAIVNPTLKNILKFQELQQQVIVKSAKFTDMWAKSLLYNPILNNRVQIPTTQYSIKMNTAKKFEEKRELILATSREYGLFYFFKGGCQSCQLFIQILAMFKEKYNCNILSISIDGQTIPELNELGKTEIDNGIASKFNVVVTPSLFLVHPLKEEVLPIGAGLISLDELEDNIFTQITDWNYKTQKESGR